jgi:hypothetical protein
MAIEIGFGDVGCNVAEEKLIELFCEDRRSPSDISLAKYFVGPYWLLSGPISVLGGCRR